MRTAVNARQTLFGGIDMVRFAAALLVMLYHYGFWIWAFPEGLAGQAAMACGAPVAARPDIGVLIDWGWIGVQVFFVVSGFVIAFSADRASPGGFARARLRRLVPAVCICAPVSVAALWLTGATWGSDAVERVLRTVLFVPFGPWVDSVYWTLGIEIAFYALILACLTAGLRDRIAQAAIVLGLVSALFWSAFLLSGAPPHWAENRWLMLLLVQHGCFFALGVQMLTLHRGGTTRAGLALCAVFVAGGLMQIHNQSQVVALKTGLAQDAVAPGIVFLAAIAFIAWSVRRDFSHPLWRRVGLMTYPLYLLHDVVGAALIGVLLRGGMGYVPAMGLVALAMIAASWLIAGRIEPAVRWAVDALAHPPRRLAGALIARRG